MLYSKFKFHLQFFSLRSVSEYNSFNILQCVNVHNVMFLMFSQKFIKTEINLTNVVKLFEYKSNITSNLKVYAKDKILFRIFCFPID